MNSVTLGRGYRVNMAIGKNYISQQNTSASSVSQLAYSLRRRVITSIYIFKLCFMYSLIFTLFYKIHGHVNLHSTFLKYIRLD